MSVSGSFIHTGIEVVAVNCIQLHFNAENIVYGPNPQGKKNFNSEFMRWTRQRGFQTWL